MRVAQRLQGSVLDLLASHRLVPVVVIDDAARAAPLAQALVDGGLPVAEVTFRTAAAADAIRTMSDRGDVLVGAGTVLTAAQVDAEGQAFLDSLHVDPWNARDYPAQPWPPLPVPPV